MPKNLNSDALRVLKDTFGFTSLRAGQEEAINSLLAANNVLAVMPTGSGKSLCFQIPALVRGGITIVVSPLVALMQNQVAALKLNGIAAATINSGQSHEDNTSVWQQVRAGEITLLYLSPERLMSGSVLRAVIELNPAFIAIDEAHCISQWGPAFRPEYAELHRLRTVFANTPIIALTATADPATRADIADKIFDGQATSVVTGFDRPNLTLAVEMKKSWKQQLIHFVANHRGESGIVYCLSRRKTEEVAEMLRAEGHTAMAYHAGMPSDARTAVQDRFMTEPATVMAATIAFGMGIDKPDIRYVFHTDLPGSPEAYYQEIGRAGRDGNPADTMMLYGLADIKMRRTFIEQEDGTQDRKRREHKRLDALLAYCEAPQCRRQTLLTYFGETIEPCGTCDLCISPVETVDATIDGQKALSAVYRTGQRYGVAHIVNVLIGKSTDKTTSAGHNQLPTFGVGANRGANEWNVLIRQLVALSFLQIDIQGFGGLALTEKGTQLIRGEATFRFRPDVVHSAKPSKSKRKAEQIADLTPEAAELLQHLKTKRLELAHERGVPAYVIFSDKTLIDMANRKPTSIDAFATVFGVGETKLRDFAAPFLAVIDTADV